MNSKQQPRLIANVHQAKKRLEMLVYSFARRYEIALDQCKNSGKVNISITELQDDLVETRRAAVALLGQVATIEAAIEDLISSSYD